MILFNSKTQQYAWLSAMHLLHFLDEWGVEWPSLEHYYQAGKCKHKADWTRIRSAESPFKAKSLAKSVEPKDIWDQVKVLRMYKGMMFILDQHPDMREALRSTVGEELVHDCPWGDVFWGKCKGEGLNIQGNLWMQHRQRLRAFRR